MNNLNRAVSRLNALIPVARKSAENAVKSAAQTALEQARAACPVRTGRLRASLSAAVSGAEARVFASAPYAQVAESRAPFLRPAADGAAFQKAAGDALKEAFQ
jgi:hypothetical protein